MSVIDTRPDSLGGESATLESQRVWKAAGKNDLDFASQRLRNRLRAKMFGVQASPIKIGRYAVLETVGSGGMGVVYSAYDDQLDRKVAVKLLRDPTDDDESSVGKGRLLREAQALAKVSHPNVVQVYEAGTFDDRVFVAMEFLPGPDLRSWLHEGPRPWQDVLRYYGQAGRGLVAAHKEGIIHRDFKPANLLFGSDGNVRVVDFGLARAAGGSTLAAGEVVQGQRSGAFSVELTQTGEIMGTPAYMAPEQARHERVDKYSDQYSFCVALYEALFGYRPHKGRNTAEVMLAVSEGEVEPPPRNTKVPARVVRAIMRGLSAEPADRFPSIEALLVELAPPSRVGLRLFGGATAVAGLGAFLAFSTAEAPCPGFEDGLADAWGADRKSAVRASFEGSGAYAAEATATAVAERLDRYSSAWTEARQDACAAHLVRKEQSAPLHDLRVACLLERRAELDALTQMFTDADAQMVAQARDAAAELSSVASCADVRVDGHVLDNDNSRELRVQLATTQAYYKAGRYPAALALVDQVIEESTPGEVDDSQPVTDRPLAAVRAQALFHRAVIQGRRRAHASAVEAYESAVQLAEQLGDDELGARALAGLAYQQAHISESADAARSLEWATRKLARLGSASDSELSLAVLDARVHVAWATNQLEDASVYAQNLVEARRRQLDPADPRLIEAMSGLAGVLDDSRRIEEARTRYRELHSLVVETYGEEHPRAAEALLELGLSFHNSGDYSDAKKPLLRAEEIFVATQGADAPALLNVNKLLGNVAIYEGQLEEAERRAQRVKALAATQELAAAHELDALGLLADVDRAREDHAAVAEHFREYIALYDSAPVAEHELRSLLARAMFAVHLAEAGDAEAAEAAQLALFHLKDHDEPFLVSLGLSAWLVIANDAYRQGDNGRTVEVISKALQPWESVEPTDENIRLERARLRWTLARAMAGTDLSQARSIAGLARQTLAELEPEAPQIAEIDGWMAELAPRRELNHRAG